jgi:ABC-type ATPase involved in cell division
MLLFRTINMNGTTVLIATHSRELLENTDQRIIVLKNGRVVDEIK